MNNPEIIIPKGWEECDNSDTRIVFQTWNETPKSNELTWWCMNVKHIRRKEDGKEVTLNKDN